MALASSITIFNKILKVRKFLIQGREGRLFFKKIDKSMCHELCKVYYIIYIYIYIYYIYIYIYYIYIYIYIYIYMNKLN